MFHTRSRLRICCPQARTASAELPRLGTACCLSSRVPTSISKLSEPAAKSTSRPHTKYASQSQRQTLRPLRASVKFSSGTKASELFQDQKERQWRKKSICNSLLLEDISYYLCSTYYSPCYLPYPTCSYHKKVRPSSIMTKDPVDPRTNSSRLSCQSATPGRCCPTVLAWVERAYSLRWH